MPRGSGHMIGNLHTRQMPDRTRYLENHKSALICVDVQNDFLPGGALGVPKGDEVVEHLLKAMDDVDFVVASCDYHPEDHTSFTEQGGIWPKHCVAGTKGAEIHKEIKARANLIVKKGTDKAKEAYSAFDGTNLAEDLRDQGVSRVLVGGLATDYCVKATALDAVKNGFSVELLLEGSRGVDVNQGDSQRAVAQMRDQGILIKMLVER